MSLDRYEALSPIVDRGEVAVRHLAEWAASAEAAHRVAEQLVKTSFVPEGFRGKPYEATAAILSGLEMGLSPMASLRSFDVIQGQAAPRAITLRAVAQAQGHSIVLEESTATRCKMRGRRAGEHEWQTITWTIDRARAQGLTNKNQWKTQPQNMLVARATSELCRLVAADAILGIAYSAEEIADGAVGEPPPVAGGPVEVAQATEGSKRMSRRKAAPEPEPAPELAPPISDTLDDGLAMSQPQNAKMRALYNECGVKDAAEQKRTTAIILGLDHLDTHNDLTRKQVSDLIETLVAVESGFLEWVRDEDGTITGYAQAEPDYGDDGAA